MMARQFCRLGIVVALVAPVAPALAVELPGVAVLLEQANYWQGKGQHDRAAQAFRQVLAIDPANAVARRGLAQADWHE